MSRSRILTSAAGLEVSLLWVSISLPIQINDLLSTFSLEEIYLFLGKYDTCLFICLIIDN